MITTVSMIQLGHVKGNKMIDMKLSNDKLTERAERIIMSELKISSSEAKDLLKTYHNVRAAIKAYSES